MNTNRRESKIPPNYDSLKEIECCIIACMFNDKEKFNTACKILTPDMFTGVKLKKVFTYLLYYYKNKKFVNENIFAHDCFENIFDSNKYECNSFIKKINESFSPSLFDNYIEFIKDIYEKKRVFNFIKTSLEEKHGLNVKELTVKLKKDLGEFIMNSNDSVSKRINFDIDKLRESQKKKTLYNLGFEALSFLNNNIVKGCFLVVGARTSVGKSSFGLNIISNLINSEKEVGCCVISLEMGIEQIEKRLLSMRLNIPLDRVSSLEFTQEEENKIKELNSREEPLYISYIGKRTLETIIEKIEFFNEIHGIEVFVIDYLQLINIEDCSEPRHLEMGQITISLKSFAEKKGIIIIGLAQLGRQSASSKNSTSLKLSDLKDSASIEQDADIVLLLGAVKNKGRDFLQVYVAKNREGEIGESILTFNKETQKIY